MSRSRWTAASTPGRRRSVVAAGASILVAGSAVFGQDDRAAAMESIRNAVSTHEDLARREESLKLRTRHHSDDRDARSSLAACNRGPRSLPAGGRSRAAAAHRRSSSSRRARSSSRREKWQRARTYFSHLYETYPERSARPPQPAAHRRHVLRAGRSGEPGRGAVQVPRLHQPLSDQRAGRLRDAAHRHVLVQADGAAGPRSAEDARGASRSSTTCCARYPNSALRPEAEARRQDALDRLARHEHLVARFYMKRGSWHVGRAAPELPDRHLPELRRPRRRASTTSATRSRASAATARRGSTSSACVTEFPESEYARAGQAPPERHESMKKLAAAAVVMLSLACASTGRRAGAGHRRRRPPRPIRASASCRRR